MDWYSTHDMVKIEASGDGGGESARLGWRESGTEEKGNSASRRTSHHVRHAVVSYSLPSRKAVRIEDGGGWRGDDL